MGKKGRDVSVVRGIGVLGEEVKLDRWALHLMMV